MNKHKFRAWCILEGKGSFIYFDLEDRCTFNFEIFDQEPIFQQYTRLKDKNGKEIYEGDLIRYEKEYTLLDKYSIIAPVVFSSFGYGFVLDSSGRHAIVDSKYGDYVPLLSSIVQDERISYEVVGNIIQTIN